jgi:hypothetical protein
MTSCRMVHKFIDMMCICSLLAKQFIINLGHKYHPFLKGIFLTLRTLCVTDYTLLSIKKPDGSLPCSQDHATGHYPEPNEPTTHTANISSSMHILSSD